MRPLLVSILLAFALSSAAAEPTVPQSKVDELKQGTGTTDLKNYQQNNQQTPQGPSGPLTTTTGGAPASSPQGQSPPGMQAAPEGRARRLLIQGTSELQPLRRKVARIAMTQRGANTATTSSSTCTASSLGLVLGA